jgi:hypothetical protein
MIIDVKKKKKKNYLRRCARINSVNWGIEYSTEEAENSLVAAL